MNIKQVILRDMVIGVVTFFKGSENYGSLLQAYALQRTLISRGHTPYLIDIDFKEFSFKSKPIRSWIRNYSINLKDSLLILLGRQKSRDLKQREIFFDQFRKDHLIVGDYKYKNKGDLTVNPPQADCFIVGSDQVWNYNFIPDFDIFFLNFGDKKILKYSYAASFGAVNLPAEISRKYKSLLENFTKISVREDNGKKLCEDLGFSGVALVPDPTLLLEKEEWLNLVGPVSSGNRYGANGSRKVFVYSLGADFKSSFGTELDLLKADSRFNVKHVSSGFVCTGYDDVGEEFPSITDWLKCVEDSEFVITNSFHGMVFSVIFEKPFIVASRAGKSSHINDRIDTFLKKIGLEKCKVSNAEDFRDIVYNFDEVKIDWGFVKERINSFRKVGFDFLSSINL